MPFESLRRRAAARAPVRPAMLAVHRGGHAIVARELGLSAPAGDASAQKPCPGVARLARHGTRESLAVIVAGQAAECLALDVRFAAKLFLAPDLALVRQHAEVRAAWTLARAILRRHLEELARCA